jgi:hypothetical protein
MAEQSLGSKGPHMVGPSGGARHSKPGLAGEGHGRSEVDRLAEYGADYDSTMSRDSLAKIASAEALAAAMAC